MSVNRAGCQAATHGTYFDYISRGCRCADAREAYRIYRKRLREGRNVPAFIDATGTARRLQSLVASGHRQADLAAQLGVSRERVGQMIHMTKTKVGRRVQARVRDLFDRLDGTDGGSQNSRIIAERRRWVDAAAWDDIDDPNEEPKLGDPDADVVDEVLIERALHGERTQLSPANRLHAVATGRRRGMPLTAIGIQLRMSHDTVRALDRQLSAA